MAKRKSRSRRRVSVDALGLEREIQALRTEIRKLTGSLRKFEGDKRRTKSN